MAEIKNPDDIATLYLAKKHILLNIAKTYLGNDKNEQAVNLVANVIVTMLEKERIFPCEEACLSYMKQIVRNSAKNSLRKSDAMLLWEGLDIESFADETQEEESPFDRAEASIILRKMIENYPYKIREAFVLHILDGVPSRELAEDMGIKHDTLRRQFSRMKKQLSSIAPSMRTQFLLLLLSQ